jgi:hypothetical protein
MSRTLPARPNLEYLKNEAKDRLVDLRRADPRAQLSDAQFALAKDYGFESWPKLKEHVESLAATLQNPLAGGWIANVAQSKRHPSNQFRSARIHFNVRGNTVDIVDEFVDERASRCGGATRSKPTASSGRAATVTRSARRSAPGDWKPWRRRTAR